MIHQHTTYEGQLALILGLSVVQEVAKNFNEVRL